MKKRKIFLENLLTFDLKSCIIYIVVAANPQERWRRATNMREWRNWQTRTFEGRVVHTVRVQVPFLAPTVASSQIGATKLAGMAELADALDSGSSRGNSVEVQVLLPAPKTEKESQTGSFSVFDTSEGSRRTSARCKQGFRRCFLGASCPERSEEVLLPAPKFACGE